MCSQTAKRIPMRHRCLPSLFGWVLLSGLVMPASAAGAATDLNPLRPPDTSSPRASLQNFETGIESAYIRMRDLLRSYIRSDRLYLNADERRQQAQIIPSAKDAVRSFDFSG